jgi:hypothetical protein
MVRMAYLTLGVAVAIGISAASAQTKRQASSKVQSMTGVVKAVFASSLTLERGGNEIRFGVCFRENGGGTGPGDRVSQGVSEDLYPT